MTISLPRPGDSEYYDHDPRVIALLEELQERGVVTPGLQLAPAAVTASAAAAGVPQHLQPIDATRQTIGTLRFNRRDSTWVIDAPPQVLEFAKRVFPGSRGRTKTVRFPSSRRAIENLQWLMLRFPLAVVDRERYEVDRQRAIEHAARRDGLAELGPAQPPHTFAGELLDWQARDAAQALANERMLIAWEMGLGKTVLGLALLALASGWPAIIVVPPHLQRQWIGMAARFLKLPVPGTLSFVEAGPEDLVHQIRGMKRYRLPERPVYVIHYLLLDHWYEALIDRGPVAVIFDEAQELRHRGSKKYNAARSLAAASRYVWGLSGTPIYNYGEEIWSVMNVIEHLALSDHDSFTVEWCGGHGGKSIEKPEQLGQYMRQEGLMIRRTKADPEVALTLPPKRRVVIEVDQDDDLFRKMISEAIGLALGYDTMPFAERGQAVRSIEGQTRLAAGVAKAAAVASFVKTLVEAGERPLVYAHHHKVHEIIAATLGDAAAMHTGKQTEHQKRWAKGRFISGDAKVMVVALRAAAGLDGLQKAGTCSVFAELDWSPAVHAQCEDRLHRIGFEGTESLLSYYLVGRNLMDREILDRLGLKLGQFVGLMGDAPETEKDREFSLEAGREHLQRVISALREMAA